MKSEAFHFEKSFEHSPKASKQLNYIVFNGFEMFFYGFEMLLMFLLDARRGLLSRQIRNFGQKVDPQGPFGQTNSEFWPESRPFGQITS